MTELARLHATVNGRVQGVGFRQATQKQALTLGLVGWVANQTDGSVEVVAEGPRPQLQRLVGWLHDVPFELGAPRVYTVLKLDERRDRPGQTLDDKVASVRTRLAADT